MNFFVYTSPGYGWGVAKNLMTVQHEYIHLAAAFCIYIIPEWLTVAPPWSVRPR